MTTDRTYDRIIECQEENARLRAAFAGLLAERDALQIENARLYLAARAVVQWKGSPDTPWHAALTRLEAVLDGQDGSGGGNGATS